MEMDFSADIGFLAAIRSSCWMGLHGGTQEARN